MRTQKGILSQKTNPFQDADVIMTAAIVGHSIRRLHKGNVNECKYCFEVEFENGTKVPLKKTAANNCTTSASGPLVAKPGSVAAKSICA